MASADTDVRQVGALAAFLLQTAQIDNAHLVRGYGDELEAVQVEVAKLSRRLRDVQATRSRIRGRLREIEETPALTPDMEDLTEQLRFIRSMHNVLDVRLEGDDLVVRITTWTVYEDQWFDLGDYDIVLIGRTQGGRSPQLFRLECVRTGLRRINGCGCGDDESCPQAYWASPLYWTSEGHRGNGVGPGSFCFGTRSSSINDLLREGQYADFVHLVIATMCSVNQNHRYHIPDRYRRLDTDPEHQAQLAELMAAHVAVTTRTSL